MIFQEPFPAIRSNLLLFKEKSKRISASIGARASVSRRNKRLNLASWRLCGIKKRRKEGFAP